MKSTEKDVGGSASEILAAAGEDTIRAYEDAATAIGRLDATAQLAETGLRELLVLRCIASATGESYRGMIALAVSGGEGGGARDHNARFAGALREGAARARGGALPTAASLHELLRLGPTAAPAQAIDDLLRDAHERTPPVLKAALAARALLSPPDSREDGALGSGGSQADEHLAALATTLVLCVGGATTDAWLTIPRALPTEDRSLRGMFTVLARDARSAARGLLAARDLADADEQRVRETLGRAAHSALDALSFLREQIVISIPQASRALSLTAPTAGAAIARLVELGIAREVTGKARSREFAYERLAKALGPSVTG